MHDLIDIKVTDDELFLKSEYSQTIVSFMRSRPKRFWDKVNRLWVLPKSELENVLKLISGCEYKITYETTEIKDGQCSIEIPDWYEFKTNPFDHQIDAVKYGLIHNKFLLADEQGLGKSKSVLDLSCILKKQDNIKHVLIVACVNGLKYNWMNEVDRKSVV